MLLDCLFILLAYLFGSIPWALVIGKVFYNTDIRNQGSGNLGGTNAGRVLGKKAGISVIALDAFKAFIIVWIASLTLKDSKDLIPLLGIACVIGHCFPIFAGFKGGKGVSTCFGFALSLGIFVTHDTLFTVIVPFIIFMVILYFSKYVSLSSMIGIATMPIIALLRGYSLNVILSLFILWVLVVYRHRSNIERIKNNTEKKITWL